MFTDPALARHAGRFVWLELDNEKAKNAPVSKRLDVRALPTFFVLDPATGKVALRWVGGASVAQLEKILEDGRLAVEHGGRAAPSGSHGTKSAAPSAADRALARADSLYGAGGNAAAAAAYGQALAAAPAGWKHYARAVESRLFALSVSDSSEACARLASDAWPR